MQISQYRKFKKAFVKQSLKIQKKFIQKMNIFVEDPFHYSLNNHALKGELLNIRSVDIIGDIRVHYLEKDGKIILMNIGSHSELY